MACEPKILSHVLAAWILDTSFTGVGSRWGQDRGNQKIRPKSEYLGAATPRSVKEVMPSMGPIRVTWGNVSLEIPEELVLLVLVKLVTALIS